jgi:glycosyltransferase involved in cell wall biosynthesis
MSRKIIIDGQIFQSQAWHRGMGKYSLQFFATLMKENNIYDDVHLIFTSQLPLEKDIEKILDGIAPHASKTMLNLKVPGEPQTPAMPKLQKHNQLKVETFVQNLAGKSSATIDFMIMGVFVDEVCSVFPDSTRNILVFYDLIPLLYSERYSKSPSYTNYLRHYKTVMQADKILSISQTVADDIVMYLGINAQKICNIDGAPINRKHRTAQKPKISMPKRFILMPSGDEIRKNNARAVLAFEEFRQSQLSDISLVITSSFQITTMQELSQISPQLIFTGNVPEEELQWLYENCQTVLFVPEYEGLGLPILEAVEARRPVVCSNLTVFNEMSDTVFYYANQLNPSSIAESLGQAAAGTDWASKKSEYGKIEERYKWPNTAKKALDFLRDSANGGPRFISPKKPRLAIFAPNPAGYSAIGKVVMMLHPELSRYFEIDYYLEDGKTKSWGNFRRPSYLPFIATTYKANEFSAKRYADYDAVLYHLGNSEFHLETTKNSLYLPGYAVIHDTHAKGLFGELSRYGYISRERQVAEQELDGLIGSTNAEYLTSIVNAQRGTVVHSDYARRAVQQINISEVPIKKLDLPTGTPKLTKHKVDTTFSIGFAGIIHEVKGTKILEQIINSPDFSDAHIYVFGIPVVEESFLKRLRSYTNVTLHTNPTDFQFQTMLSNMDVVVSYRPKYMGETSLTIIEAMRFGVTPLVRKVGWFDELPDDCVLKAVTGEDVMRQLLAIKQNTRAREQFGINAKKLTKEKNNYEVYARLLAEFISTGGPVKNPTDTIAARLREHVPLKVIENLVSSS